MNEKENKESDGVDDQDENTDDLCGESDYRNEPFPCSLTMHSKNQIMANLIIIVIDTVIIEGRNVLIAAERRKIF